MGDDIDVLYKEYNIPYWVNEKSIWDWTQEIMNNPYLSGDEKAKRLNAMWHALQEKAPVNWSL